MEEVKRQQDLLVKCCEYAKLTGIKIFFLYLLPKFPVNDKNLIREIYPELLDASGDFDPENKEFQSFVSAQMDELLQKNPDLSGLDVWLAEGAGKVIYHWPDEGLERLENYLLDYINIIKEKTQKHNLDFHFFTHRANHTRQTRRTMYSLFEEHQDICLTEDISWPEEFTTLKTLASMDDDVKEMFLSHNRKKLNFLLDTEYMGQGVVPSILPDWYKQQVNYCLHHNINCVSGRIMWRDGNHTLTNHNLGNVYCFGAFAWSPDKHAQETLKEYLALRYGSEWSNALAGVFSLAEEIIRKSFTVNGLGFSSRSAFPNILKMVSDKYREGKPSLKCVGDLANPSGTPLFSDDKDLRSAQQWRHQLKIYALAPEQYYGEKDEAISLAKYACDKLRKVDFPDRDEVLEDFEALYYYAKAMKLYLRLVLAENGGNADELKTAIDGLRGFADDLAEIKGEDFYFKMPLLIRELIDSLQDQVIG